MTEGSSFQDRAKVGFLGRIPLSLKVLVFIGVIGLVSWFVIDRNQTVRIQGLFEKFQLSMLGEQSRVDRLRLDDYLRAQSQAIRMVSGQVGLKEYLAKVVPLWKKRKEPVTLHHSERPNWLPRLSIVRELTHSPYILLMDGKRRVREVFHGWEEKLTAKFLTSSFMREAGAQSRNSIVEVKGAPYLITVEGIGPEGGEEAFLAFLAPLDTEFLSKFRHRAHSKGIVAIIDKNNAKVLATSRPDLVKEGADLKEVRQKYLVVGNPFFHYGFYSDILIQFATLTAWEEIDAVTQGVVSAERSHKLVSAAVLLVAFTLVMGWVSWNIRQLIDRIIRFSESNLKVQLPDAPSGDQLSRLQALFGYFIEEIRKSREALTSELEARKRTEKELEVHKNNLEALVERRTRELSESNSRLQVEIAERIQGERTIREQMVDLEEASQEAEEHRAEVEALNASLEMRVHDEVEQNRQKDLILMHQSRLAAMGEMIGNIAHQWRQPINALNLILANLRDAQEFGELTTEMLQAQTGNGQKIIMKMSSTIDDFRNFFKPDKTREIFNLEEVVRDAVSLVGTSFSYHHIKLTLEPPPEQIRTLGFPNEYSQVLLLLLVNAKDAIMECRDEGGEVTIKIFTMDANALVTIQDNGGGIPKELVEKIFDPYFTTKEDRGGAGIGLYMAKMIIEGHMRGRIRVGRVDQGALFQISIPIITEEPVQPTLPK